MIAGHSIEPAEYQLCLISSISNWKSGDMDF